MRSALKPAMPKKTGAKKAVISAAQLFVDVACEDWGFADQDAGDEGAKHGMHADQMRDERHDAHDHENGGDHCEFADEDVVDPADDEKHSATADGQAGDHEGERADDTLARAKSIRPSRAAQG